MNYLPALAMLIASVFALSASGQHEPKRIRPGEQCPVSMGSHPTGLRESSVFCAECLWFGSGPAYFAWAYKLGGGDNAVFELSGAPRDMSGYSTKTPWVALSNYSGPIAISGFQLDGKGTLRFESGGSKMEKKMVLTAPNHEPGDHWSFWPAGMDIPHSGCYAVQIETSKGKDFVDFKAET